MTTLAAPSPSPPSAPSTLPSTGTSTTHPYTCLACSLAFTSAPLQRAHYSTDLHRYNAKRRVAGLGPVSAEVFVQKVQERQGVRSGPAEEAAAGAKRGKEGEEGREVETAGKARRCEACGKTFASEGAERSHLASKKHRDAVFKGAAKALDRSYNPRPDELAPPLSKQRLPSPEPMGTTPDTAASLDDLIAHRIRAAESLPPLSDPATSCLFCAHSAASISENLAHMLSRHGFFVPDQEYLVDARGLLRYLAEGVAAWSVCVFCGAGFGGEVEGGGGVKTSDKDEREAVSKGLERVRKHMIDKSHCKLAWETEAQRLEVSDYYDFRASYPDYKRQNSKPSPTDDIGMNPAADDGDEGWEDVPSDSDPDSDGTLSDGEDDVRLKNSCGVSFGDTPFELVLPSGRRIGHRALRHIYRSNVVPYALDPSPSSRANRLISKLALDASQPSRPEPELATEDPLAVGTVAQRLSHAAQTGSLASAALVPTKGGLGAYGMGKEVVKARNRGEAKEAGRATREFREGRRREAFRTRIGIKVGNNQKHYRDPLLQ